MFEIWFDIFESRGDFFFFKGSLVPELSMFDFGTDKGLSAWEDKVDPYFAKVLICYSVGLF